MHKTILVWDFDNTLGYRKGMWGQTAITLLQKHGLTDLSSQDLSPYLHHGFPWHEFHQSHHDLFGEIPWWEYVKSLVGQALQHLHIPAPIITDVLHNYREAYLDVRQWSVFDDTVAALERMSDRGFEQIILSNHVPELHELVTGLHLAKYFAAIWSSAHIGYEKPHARCFDVVLNTHGRQHAYIMIGDSYQADILGAQSMNIPAILVRHENRHHYPLYCSDLTELDDVLAVLGTEPPMPSASSRAQEGER